MTAASSFHGTGMFDLPTVNNSCEERPPVTLPPNGRGHTLPEEYATVHPVELDDTSKAVVPVSLMKEPESCMAVVKQREERWLEYSLRKLDEGSVSSSETVTWAAYHASTQTEEDPPALTALHPLFYEKAATPAMVKRGKL